jgi:hypothetical protein
MNFLEVTRELIALRKKPSTEARFKSYPSLLKQFIDELEQCNDVQVLRQVIELDSGYYLLAGYRQKTLEKWLALERTPEVLRLLAMQFMLFGEVDDIGNANTEVDAKVSLLEAEADQLERGGTSE